MSRLSEYRRKRNFAVTSEPAGKVKAPKKLRRFVIQRHAARRLHYDLRLELDGVYKSWAVTKVPSLDPSVKRLAVEVEDHPLQYGTFEGTIPQGEYGGGTVQLWDRGRWLPQSNSSPKSDLVAGHLKFELRGERMRGGWALIRMRDEPARPGRKIRRNWLLVKERDAAAIGDPDALGREMVSVKSGRTMQEITAGSKKKATRRTATKSRTRH